MVDDLCALRDMGDCAGALRPTVIGINGVLRRLVVCHGHYAFLGEHSTPLRAAPPKPTGTEDTAGERPARTKMITPAGQFVAACLLRDGRRLPWPTVRVVMESYGIKPGKGRLPGTKIRDVRAAVESSGLPEGVTAEAPTGTSGMWKELSPTASTGCPKPWLSKAFRVALPSTSVTSPSSSSKAVSWNTRAATIAPSWLDHTRHRRISTLAPRHAENTTGGTT